VNSPKKPDDTGKLKGQTFQAAGLVDIQDGAIVSREIIHEKTGTVTVFAFDRGQGLSEHTAPFDALVLGLEGAAVITIGGAPHALKAGELVIMPAGVPHALKADTRFKMLLVMVKK
jgi:quercetin dioxygenase-like cupin family protein